MIPHCGKCDSTMVYRDDDRVNGAISIACRACGNRWPGGVEFYMAENKEGEMKKPCRNCERTMTIVGDRCCFVCYHAAKGLEGDEKAAALAEIRKKIENGGVKKGGLVHKKNKPPTADTSAIESASRKATLEEARKKIERGSAALNAIEKKISEQSNLLNQDHHTEIPITLRLTIEIGIRIAGVAA